MKEKPMVCNCNACRLGFEAPALWVSTDAGRLSGKPESIVIVEVKHNRKGAGPFVVAYHADGGEGGTPISVWMPDGLRRYLSNIGATRKA